MSEDEELALHMEIASAWRTYKILGGMSVEEAESTPVSLDFRRGFMSSWNVLNRKRVQ